MKIKELSNCAEQGRLCNINYEPPCIEVVEVIIEKGFADSTADFGEETW